MNQYCRYCAHCIYGDALYCAAQNGVMDEKSAKQVNKCKDFDFCEIDVFDHERTYKPRQISELAKNQIKFDWRQI